MTRRYGHLRGIARPSDKPMSQLCGAPERPPAVSYASRVDRVRDQLDTSSCEGQAFSTAVFLRAAIAGSPIPHPSAMALYALARELDQGPTEALVDGGTYARSVAAALSKTGVVSEDRYPFDASKINQRPPWGLVQAGSDARITLGDAYWIRTSGAQRCDDLRSALAAGFPVTFGLEVDQSFEDGGWAVYVGPKAPSLGGHCLPIVGYRPGAFQVLNSWGASWGQGGFAWIADSVIGSDDLSSDFCMVEVAPKAVE